VASALVGCSGTSGFTVDGASGSSAASGTQTPDVVSTNTPSATTTTAPTRSTSTHGSTPTGPLTVVPSSSRTTLAPQPIASPGAFGGGVAVAVVTSRAVTVTGRGVGEVSGPAVAFTLRLSNAGTKALSLSSALVSADYGDEVPASPSTGVPARPWPGSVPAGGQVTGTFVFLVPEDQRSRVRLSVSYAPTAPVVVLAGPAAS